MNIAEIRQKYPQYASVSDDELADALHQKYYSQVPRAEFRAKIGLGNGAEGGWGRGAEGSWDDPRLADKSSLERYRMGGKIGLGEIALGIKQIVGKATPEDVDAYRRENAPLLEDSTVRAGNTSSYVATALPTMMIPGAQTIAGSAALGGAYGAIQPVGTGESRVNNTLKGAGTAGAVTTGLKAFGRVLQPIRNANQAPEQAAVDTLQGEGVQLSVGQQTGSRATLAAERMLSNNPYTGPAMSEQARKQAESFTRAALRTAGVDAAGATPQVVGAAKDRIGKGMDAIFSRTRVALGEQDLQAIQAIEQSAARQGVEGPFKAIADDIRNNLAAGQGRLDGKFYQKIRRDLQALESKADYKALATDFREGLDNAFHASASGADRAALTTLRGQYRNLMSIADAADTTNRGLVSPASLAQRMKSGKYTKGEFRYRGEDALAKLARSGSTLVDRMPNSGTAAHVGAQLVAPTIAGGASYLNDGDYKKAAAIAATAYGIPKGAAFALNNPSVANYLARGVPMPPVANQLGQYLTRIAPPVATSLVVGQ
jgi:hypothetical protein